jgi:PAS domain S-box-containing protein
MDNLEKNKDTDSIRSFEYRALRKDGTTFPILLRIRAITRGDKVIGHRGVVVNISERKKMEEPCGKMKTRCEVFSAWLLSESEL